jgi:hypothetical protein
VQTTVQTTVKWWTFNPITSELNIQIGFRYISFSLSTFFLHEVFRKETELKIRKWNWKKDARHPTECWKINMAFCVGIRTHVIRGTIVQIPECLSHYAIEAMILEKLYYIFKYFQIIYASLWQFQRLLSKPIILTVPTVLDSE